MGATESSPQPVFQTQSSVERPPKLVIDRRAISSALADPSATRRFLDIPESVACRQLIKTRAQCSNAIFGTAGYDCRSYCMEYEGFPDDQMFVDSTIRELMTMPASVAASDPALLDNIVSVLTWKLINYATAKRLTQSQFINNVLTNIPLRSGRAIPVSRLVPLISRVAVLIANPRGQAMNVPQIADQMRAIALRDPEVDNETLKAIVSLDSSVMN